MDDVGAPARLALPRACRYGLILVRRCSCAHGDHADERRHPAVVEACTCMKAAVLRQLFNLE